MFQKIKEKLSNLNDSTVSSFIIWLGVFVTFVGLCVDAFYTLGAIPGTIAIGIMMMLVGFITLIFG